MRAEESPFCRAALGYIERGLAVIPLRAGAKEPATTSGINDWTDNPGQADVWWKRNPRFNVGVVTGQHSGGVIALDFDVHDEKRSGLDFLRDWQVEHGELPETWTQVTGSGGRQMFYRVDREVRNSANGEIGVDVRGDGGFVVAPPSIHPCGDAYEWSVSPDDMECALADAKVYEFIDAVRPVKRDADGWRSEPVSFPDEITANRNETLFALGRSMLSKGMPHDIVAESLMSVNRTRCRPPLPDREMAKLIGSVNTKEPGNPERDARMATKGRPSTSPDAVEGGDGESGFRGPRGGLRTNELAKEVIRRNRACIIDGAPAVWTGSRWDFGVRAINRCTLALADDAKKQDKSEVVSYIMDKAPHVSSDFSFDGGYYVQFANATVDVQTGQAVEPEPNMYIIAALPVEYDPDAAPNEADEFIDSIAGGDADTASSLMEVIGACMCSRRAISQSPMLIGRAGGATGKASNGKSTYINWLRAILGTENTKSMDIATIGQRFQAGNLVGKLANLGDDIPSGFLRGDELSVFKKIVTGDSIFTDVKNGDGFEFRPSATMVFSMNEVPRLSDTTDGIFRRLAFIPFRRRFDQGMPGFDPDMAKKLAKPSVLRRGALLGLLALPALIERGRIRPLPDMVAEVDEVRKDNDSVERWIYDEQIGFADLYLKPVSSAYKMYSDWCEESGERSPFSRRKFTTRLMEHPFDTTDEHGNYVVYLSSEPRYFSGNTKSARVFVTKK